MKSKAYRTFMITTAAVACLGACTPTKHTRGNIVQDYQLVEVQQGADTKSDVMRKIGSPTTIAPFDDNIWYYIGQTTQKKGILDEAVMEERVIVISFNHEGYVQTIDDMGSQRENIPFERDKTPTSGNEMTVLQQLMGNLGKFNPEE